MNKKKNIDYIKSEFNKIQNYFISHNFEKVIEKTLILMRKSPHQVVFYNYIGLSYRQLGQYQNAESIFKKGLKIFPKSFTILTNLGSLYRLMLRYEDAEDCLTNALEINKNDFAALSNMGNLQRDLNKHELSIEYYEKAYQLNNNNETLLFNLAGAYQIINKFEKSKKILKEIHRKFPKNIKSDYMFSSIHDYEKNDDHRQQMLQKLENKMQEQDKVYLYFALSKSYSDINDYKKSSEYFKIANMLQYTLMKNYDFDKEMEVFEIIKEKFKNYKFKSTKSNKFPSKIFIVGLPRSGTTLTHQIISSHSKVYGAGELPIINKIFNDKIRDNKFLTNFFENSSLSEKLIQDLSEELEKFFQKYGKDIILDKAPLNFIWVGFIKILFPDAKVIHCKRNLKDTALSIYKNCFDGQSIPWSYNENTLVKFINAYQDLMEFWNQKLPDYIYNLDYETLISDQVNETKKIIGYCNLDWEENCINYTKNKAAIKTVSISQARKPIYSTSKNLSEKYLDYLGFLRSL